MTVVILYVIAYCLLMKFEQRRVKGRVWVLNCGMLRMLKMVLTAVVQRLKYSTHKHKEFINKISQFSKFD